MSDSARRLKANRVIAEKPCAACRQAVPFGHDAAVCGVCESPHHAACWDRAGGCGKEGCANAPLRQIEPAPVAAPAAAALGPGMVQCPHCGRTYLASRGICPACKRAPTATGQYTGERRNAPGAVASMVWGIVSIFFCGLITGILAITKSSAAKQAIAHDPRFVGAGMATAGMVLGIVGIVLFAIQVLVAVAT